MRVAQFTEDAQIVAEFKHRDGRFGRQGHDWANLYPTRKVVVRPNWRRIFEGFGNYLKNSYPTGDPSQIAKKIVARFHLLDHSPATLPEARYLASSSQK